MLAIFGGCGMLLGLLIWQSRQAALPDFSSIPAGEARKAAFFEYLGPIIDRENAVRRDRRQRLQALRGRVWSKRERLWVEELADKYDVDLNPTDQAAAQQDLTDEVLIDRLLIHVDTIPYSLALAQAAKESAWGTSRFAVEGFNLFGQRCYTKGCGMVPAARRRGAKFEVRRFDSVEASVASYMNNINGHPEYQSLRSYRAAQRQRGKPVSGIEAAERIDQYSERREAYIDEVQALIHFNNLEDSQ